MAKVSLWKEDSHLSKIIDIAANISDYTIDIFDSLLLKTTKETKDFHKKVYRKAQKAKVINVDIGEDYYAELRTNIEINVKKDQTLMLESILKPLEHIISDIDALVLLEVETLKELCYLNLFSSSLIEELILKGISIKLINNSFYTTADVRNLLVSLGGGFESLEIIRFKDISFNKSCLYISSNKNNIAKAKEKNLTTLFYDYLNYHMDSPIDLEELYYIDNDTKFYMLRKLMENTIKSKENLFFKIGVTILGPLLSMYIKQIYSDMKKEKITLVLPLMREGSLLAAMLERFAENQNDKEIEVRPLYISRKSSYLPSLTEDTSAADVFSFFEGIPISLNDFMKMFELSIDDVKYGELSLYSLKKKYPTVCETYKRFFMENVNLTNIKNENKKLLEEYMLDIIKKHKKIATLDIGFNGTIQENIEKILNNYKYNWKHYLLIAREGVIRKLFSGMRISSYINNEVFAEYKKDIIRSVDVFEQLVIGIDGTTLAYKQQQNKVVPVCEIMNYSKSEIDNRNSIKQGILFFEEIFSLILNKFEDEVDFNKLGYMLHRLVQYPTKNEAIEIGSLSYSSNFGSLGVQKLIDIKTIVNASEEYKKKTMSATGTSYLASGICWPQGELVLQDDTYSINFIVKKDFVKFSKILMKQIDGDYEKIAIYGAGEVGSEVSKILNFLSIKPTCIIDKDTKLHGTVVNELEVIPPTDLPKSNIDTIIIASLTFVHQIEKDLSLVYGEKFDEIKIVKLELGN